MTLVVMSARQPHFVKMAYPLLLLLLIVNIITAAKPAQGEKDGNIVQKLITKLFKSYNKEAVLDMPIVIHMDILLLKVKNTIEKEGIFESVIALMIEWYDRRISWNPVDYANLTFLSLATDQVWLPDIAMTNSAEHLYAISRDSRFMVRVSYDGLFKFVPSGTAKTWCDLKLLTFPFDIQHCSLEFESWSLDSTTMTFDGHSELLVDTSFASTQFQLCRHRAITYYHTYNFTGETFTRLRFEFTVRRKSTFYVINLIFPCATLSGIQLLTFLIPSTDTTVDRIGFGTTNLLTLVVFQTIVTEEMPKTSDAVTALSRYVICLVCMAAVSILESVIVDRLLEKTLDPPPSWLLKLLKYVPIILHETPAARRKRSNEQNAVVKPEPQSHHPNCPPVDNLSQGHDYENESNVCLRTKRNGNSSTAAAEQRELDELRRISYYMALSNGNCNLPPPFMLRNNNETKPPPCTSTLVKQPSNAGLQRIGVKGAERRRRSSVGLVLRNPNPDQDVPSDLWAEVAFKVDFLMLCACTGLALFAPITMFLPLVAFNDEGECGASNATSTN